MLEKALKCIISVIFNFASILIACVLLSEKAIFSQFDFWCCWNKSMLFQAWQKQIIGKNMQNHRSKMIFQFLKKVLTHRLGFSITVGVISFNDFSKLDFCSYVVACWISTTLHSESECNGVAAGKDHTRTLDKCALGRKSCWEASWLGGTFWMD